MRLSILPACAAIAALCGIVPATRGESPPATTDTVQSRDGRIVAEIILGDDPAKPSIPVYRVTFRDRPVAVASRLGVNLADGSILGADSTIEDVTRRKIDEAFTQFPGKRSKVVHKAEEATISLREKAEPRRRWQVILRASDDGIAFRYVFPEQEGWHDVAIAGERTEFRFPSDAVARALPLKGFTSSHEARYETRKVADLPGDQVFGLPLLVEFPGMGWAAVAEANLTEYAGLYVARGEGGGLIARLSPLPKEPKVAVRTKTPHHSPWRVLMIADKVERLVESDLILSLNAPSEIGDTSWIKPGKTTFPWWNGFYEEKVPFKMGLNTETAKYYIDFCAEAGIPYHSLDGLDNVAWYGGTIVPYEGAGITHGLPGLDLKEVLAYAKSKGVKIRLWMHWAAAEKHMEKAFPLYREWGVEGVMLDFMDRDDQEMNRFLRRAIKLCADNHLTITLHGVAAPTGLERTFPNLLTHEGVMNLEYDKWDKEGVSPEHELMIPFTRMLAGPLDFHQGSLRGVPVAKFQPRNDAPLVMGTPCRMLASYVVLQDHLPMMADYPSAYRGHPGLPIMVKIPSTWDETRCLSGEVGKLAVIARRHGDEWWVGAMTDLKARFLEIPLDFLGDGKFQATVYRDDLGSKFGMAERTVEVGSKDSVSETLAPSGGVLIHLKPAGR